jgi:hypothetical protein
MDARICEKFDTLDGLHSICICTLPSQDMSTVSAESKESSSAAIVKELFTVGITKIYTRSSGSRYSVSYSSVAKRSRSRDLKSKRNV